MCNFMIAYKKLVMIRAEVFMDRIMETQRMLLDMEKIDHPHNSKHKSGGPGSWKTNPKILT